MALLHPHSSETINEGLDLFSLPPSQTSVESGQYVEHHPLAAITQGSPIEFLIRGNGDEYLDLANTYLHVQAKIVKEDGSALSSEEVTAKVGPINYWMHSLFCQVDASLNDTLITDSTMTYPYRAYIEALLSYSTDVKSGQLTSALFYRDSPNKFNSVDDENEGFKMRAARTKGSAEVDMIGRLHLDICCQNRYILNGVDFKLRLSPSKHTFNQMSSENTETLTVITYTSLFARKVKLNPSISLAHAKMLEKTTAKYPLNRVVIKTFSIPKGNMSCVQDNLFLTQLPKRVVVGMVSTAGFLGNYKNNPFNFETFGLNHLSLSIDGKQYPSKPFKPNFKDKKYARSFYHQYVDLGLHQGNESNGISYEDFCGGFTLYVFDLSPSLLDGNVVELLKSGNLRLDIGLKEALTSPIHVIVYGELDSLLEIDRNRQILTDFTS